MQWPTLPTLIMAPILTFMYIRLARKEEREVLHKHPQYKHYLKNTPAFLPIMINNEKKALELLKIAAQYLQQVIRMVEEKEYCLDIIQKSRVVQRYMKMADARVV